MTSWLARDFFWMVLTSLLRKDKELSTFVQVHGRQQLIFDFQQLRVQLCFQGLSIWTKVVEHQKNWKVVEQEDRCYHCQLVEHGLLLEDGDGCRSWLGPFWETNGQAGYWQVSHDASWLCLFQSKRSFSKVEDSHEVRGKTIFAEPRLK